MSYVSRTSSVRVIYIRLSRARPHAMSSSPLTSNSDSSDNDAISEIGVAVVGDDDDGSNKRKKKTDDRSKHTFESYGGENVDVISISPDARLASSLLSCLSLTESLFVPTTIGSDGPGIVGTAPPNATTVSKDPGSRGARARRATDGLYAAWFEGKMWRLLVPGTDPTKSWSESEHATTGNLLDAIDAFRKDWNLVKVHVQKSEYVAHQKVDGKVVLRYPLNAKTLNALKTRTEVRPVDVNFWAMLPRNASREREVMRAVMRGERLYTPETRGDLVRLHNASVLSKATSDYARLMTCVELMRQCTEDVKNSLFVSFTGKQNRQINDKHIILYNFCLKGGGAPLNPRSSVSGVYSTGDSLKREQREAAEAFAKKETRCSLLYWSPGVGKTLGAWAAIVEAAKVEARGQADQPFTTGVTFLSSGSNLPENKFVAELKSNAAKLGVTIVTSEKTPVKTLSKKNTPYVLGWYWDITVTTNDTVDLHFKVLACTYLGFSRGSATLLFGPNPSGPWFAEGHDKLFKSPRTTCDLVLNVCDEAHVLRATKMKHLTEAKTDGISKNNKNIPSSDHSTLKRYHAWAWPTTEPNWSKIPWEGLRVADNAYDPTSPSALPKNKVVKTLLTTATPFGNSPSHLPNLFACGLYSANAEETYLEAADATKDAQKGDGDEIALDVIEREERKDEERIDKEVDDANKAENNRDPNVVAGISRDAFAVEPIAAGTNGDVETIARSTAVLERLLYGSASGSETDGAATSVKASVATIDPATAPRQDFGCCHFFSGEGGTVIAPGGTTGRTGGVPWSQPKLVEAAVLEPMESTTEVRSAKTNIYLKHKTTGRTASKRDPVKDVTKAVERENADETMKHTSTYVVTYDIVDDDHDGDDMILKKTTANVRGPLIVTDGELIANFVKKRDGVMRVRCADVEEINRDPPVSLIRRVHRLYVSRRDNKTRRPPEDTVEKPVPGENAMASDAPEGERRDAANSSSVANPAVREDDDESESESDDDNIDAYTTNYEDVGIYYWRWDQTNKTEVERVSLAADLEEEEDDGEEGTKGEHTKDDSRKRQLMRLHGLYRRGLVANDGGAATRRTTNSMDLNETNVRGMRKKWYEHFVEGKTAHTEAQRTTFLRKHLRAYSPRYELFFRMLENDVVADRRRTPVIVFFRKIRGFSLETLGGFEWYADMRDRRRHADFPTLDGTEKHRYWFLKFKSKDSTEPFAYDENKSGQRVKNVSNGYNPETSNDEYMQELSTVAECLMFYKLVYEEEVRVTGDSHVADATLKNIVLRRVRELLWDKVEKREGEDSNFREEFIENPGRHHVVISVTGDQGENAREWASYLLDESTGAYNHPVNRFGEIVRVMAGADKIGESNDFRSTRHMFFMNPETDVVKLLQKFGRICRSSDPVGYPYYRYGFHRDHLGNDGNEVPIVHYVTLSLPDETANAFDIIKEKAKFYNPYGRLLARGKGDEGLVIREQAGEGDWTDAVGELGGPRPVKFNAGIASGQNQNDFSVLSNLYGDVEWDWAATYFEQTEGDETILGENLIGMINTVDSVVFEWLNRTKIESRKWTTEDLKDTIANMFPHSKLVKDWEQRAFDPVPTGVVPRLFLNNLFEKGIGQFNMPALKIMFEKTNVNRVGEKRELPDNDILRVWKDLCERKVRKKTLQEIMENKFETGKYRETLVRLGNNNPRAVPNERESQVEKLTNPFGYELVYSDAILRDVRENAIKEENP
jgi:hypothetical protein